MPGRPGRVDFGDRHEFVEDAVIEHDPQPVALATIGGSNKALAGRIDLAGFGPAALEPFGKARAIGREIDPAMDDEFEPREEID
jgi:hypothetical protein